MHGAPVRALQRELTAAGYTTAVTGMFDTATMNQVLAFQRQYGLRPTGRVTKSTLVKLREVAVSLAILNSPDTALTGSINATGTAASAGSGTGGISFAPGPNNAPVQAATLQADGLAVPPSGAPQTIRQVIAGADMIAFDPYIYGGGHQSFNSSGYDCSGSVSYALHAGGLLSSPYDSTQFESYGQPGPGRWITLWANGGHVYMEIAGLFYDTAAQSYSNGNDRWSPVRVSPGSGFIERHPTGW